MSAWTLSPFRGRPRFARRASRRSRLGRFLGGRIGPEWLEDRTLLAQGVVSGVVFNDANGNASRDPGESGQSGWTVYLDVNFNGSLEAGEPSTVSAADGSYSISADSGFYSVREVLKPGFQQTSPAGGNYTHFLLPGQTQTGFDFGNQTFVPGTISGTVFNDANSSGARDPGEGGLAGWTVYLDANFDGSLEAGEPSVVTGGDGTYSFSAAPGFYIVREVIKPNYTLTSPSINAQSAPLTLGGAVSNLNFGNFSLLPPATISGTAFADLNGNGARDPGEGPLSGWTVYLDANNNGSLDAGESSLVTGASGVYSFSVFGGTYKVREVVQAGYTQTAPASGVYSVTVADGDTAAGRDFGNRLATIGTASISGNVYEDLNNNGARDPSDTPLSAWTVFIDRNLNGVPDVGEPTTVTGASGDYSFELGPGTYAVREIVQSGYVQTAPTTVAHVVPLFGAPVSGRDFGNYRPPVAGKGTISGAAYNDANGNGSRDSGEGALLNWTIYLDANNNGVFNVGEPSTLSDAGGNYSFVVDAGSYTVREVTQAGYTQTAPASGSYAVTVAAGGTVSGRDFGNRAQGNGLSTLTGTVFLDANQNTFKEPNEPGQAGWTVFLDLNFNGTPEPNEQSTISGPNGSYSFTVTPGFYIIREVLQSDYIQTTPPGGVLFASVSAGGSFGGLNFGNFSSTIPATISGAVFSDTNGNGTLDAGEGAVVGSTVYLDADNNGSLDAGESSTLSNGTGAYSFPVLPGGYTVRQVVPAGFTQTAPASGSYAVTIASGGIAAARDFGDAPDSVSRATISGAVYNDANGNGSRNAGEGGLAGWTVYLDSNNNSSPDAGEPTAVTAADGRYSFIVLAGTYRVREVVQAGYAQTSPAAGSYVLTVAAGGLASGNDFGSWVPQVLGSVSGTVYLDANNNGARDAAEGGLAGWTVYLDADNNGALDAGETSAVSDAGGNYNLAAVAGVYTVREVVSPGYTQTAPAGGFYTVTVVSGGTVTGRDFGNKSISTTGTVTGVIFNDLNLNHVRDAGEPGLSGWTAYLDLNFNGSLDAGEPKAVSGADGTYTINAAPGLYVLREVIQLNWTQTTPPSNQYFILVATGGTVSGLDFGNKSLQPKGTISGTVFEDADGSGSRDAGEGPLAGRTVYLDANNNGSLDSGETSIQSDASGGYSFTVDPGGYVVREIVQSGYVRTAPASGFYSVTVANGDLASGRDFGDRLVPTTGTVRGVVFNDQNSNAVRDAGEAGLSGWAVYADLNFNNALDAGEPSTLSGPTGSYSLNLLPGFYLVREVVQAGFAQTLPAIGFYFPTVAVGDVFNNFDFGNHSTSVAALSALGTDSALGTTSAPAVAASDPGSSATLRTASAAGTAVLAPVDSTVPPPLQQVKLSPASRSRGASVPSDLSGAPHGSSSRLRVLLARDSIAQLAQDLVTTGERRRV